MRFKYCEIWNMLCFQYVRLITKKGGEYDEEKMINELIDGKLFV